jgi:phosphate transport system protein
MSRLQAKIGEMGEVCQAQLKRAVRSLVERDTHLAEAIIEADTEVNRFQKEVDEMTARTLATRQPMAVDLRQVIAALKIATDLERVADYAKNIAKHVPELNHTSLEKPVDAIIRMTETAGSMLQDILRAYAETDDKAAVDVWHRDDEIDAAYAELLGELKSGMKADASNIKAYTSLLFVARCCERIGDHITNVAENVYYIKNGEHLYPPSELSEGLEMS